MGGAQSLAGVDFDSDIDYQAEIAANLSCSLEQARQLIDIYYKLTYKSNP